MKFSMNWLKEFVPIDGPTDDIRQTLTSVGLPVETVETTPDGDQLLDIEIFSNRPDCMNVYGIAREIASATGRGLCPYPGHVTEDAGAPASDTLASVSVDAPDLCRRYSARIVRGVKVGPSPDWLSHRLALMGNRPVNNVVDATNYVLWEFGHPLHAFDLSTLGGRRIIVRGGRNGESLVTLDDIRRTMDSEVLVIADESRPVALAGIMGGASTMVNDKTVDLLLECAHFDPVSVRRTSKRLSLSTDASYRFERGTDIEATVTALNRVASLITEIAGGSISPGILDQRAGPSVTRRIHLRAPRVSTLLGLTVGKKTIVDRLERLSFKVTQDKDAFDVEVPSHRQDIDHEVDLIEEVGRSIGYDAIPERMPHIAATGGIARPGHRRETAIRRALHAAGCSEAITSSFVSSNLDWGLRQRLEESEPGIEALRIANPIAADQEILRTTLLPGLLSALAHNVNRGMKRARLFEIGHTFRAGRAVPPSHRERKHPPEAPPDENVSLGIALTGDVHPRHWLEKPRNATFYDVKGLVETLLREVGLTAAFGTLPPSESLQSGSSSLVSVAGISVGRIGGLTTEWRERVGLKQEVWIAELDLTRIYLMQVPATRFRPLPRHPSVSRDLSLIVKASTRYAAIETAIRATAPDQISAVTIVDRYESRDLPAGTIGMTVNIVYQHPERTLTSGEVADLQGKILAALTSDGGISLRE